MYRSCICPVSGLKSGSKWGGFEGERLSVFTNLREIDYQLCLASPAWLLTEEMTRQINGFRRELLGPRERGGPVLKSRSIQ